MPAMIRYGSLSLLPKACAAPVTDTLMVRPVGFTIAPPPPPLVEPALGVIAVLAVAVPVREAP
jgi:hypothetical protein